jgi:hypothetical protein
LEALEMIYELRVYHAIPGKLPSVLKRFSEVTLPIWKRLGIAHVGFWTTLVGSSNQELVYMLAWESLADREAKWNTFLADPEWVAKRAASDQDGPLVANISNTLLNPTSFGWDG